MIKYHLNEAPIEHSLDYILGGASFSLQCLLAAQHLEKTSPHLRFLFSLGTYNLQVEGKEVLVSERSAVKVACDAEITVPSADATPLYVVTLHANEERFNQAVREQPTLHQLVQVAYANTSETVNQRALAEWDEIKGKSSSYISASERNSQHIAVLPDATSPKVVIAPPSSRFNPLAGNGWHLMYMRGSQAVGVGSDRLYQVRAAEVLHHHHFVTEVYVGLDGRMELAVGDQSEFLTRNDVVILSPGSKAPYHGMVQIHERYAGLTLQIPSIPGAFDRIVKPY